MNQKEPKRRPPSAALVVQELNKQMRPTFATAIQELSKQNRQQLAKSLGVLNPSLAEQVRSAVSGFSVAERAMANTNFAENAAQVFRESLAASQLNGTKMIKDSLAQSQLSSTKMIKDSLAASQLSSANVFKDSLAQSMKAQRLFADATKSLTLSDTLRETLNTLKTSRMGIDLKVATTGILAEQAAVARMRISQQAFAGIFSGAQWENFRSNFATQAADALSVAGLNAERELQRLRDEALRDRELAREALRSRGARAVDDDPIAGLEDVPELLQELIEQMHALAATIRSLRSSARVQYLGLLLTLIMFIYQIAWDQLGQPPNPQTPPAPLVDIDVHVHEGHADKKRSSDRRATGARGKASENTTSKGRSKAKAKP